MMLSLKSSMALKAQPELDRRALFKGVIHHGVHLYNGMARLWSGTNAKFIELLAPMLYTITSCVRCSLPQEYLIASNINPNLRIGETPFTGVASNLYDATNPNFPSYSELHIDGNDVFCAIVPMGHWGKNEGILIFPELNLMIGLRPGDLVIFKSAMLYHMVSRITTGYRNSLVFFAHKTLLKDWPIAADFKWINNI